jgi:hypothetical protein
MMADAISPATGRCYGVARVCRVWEVPRFGAVPHRREL